MCRFWRGAAALGVLAAAGRLAAGLPVFPVHLSLRRGGTGVSQAVHTPDKQNNELWLMSQCLLILISIIPSSDTDTKPRNCLLHVYVSNTDFTSHL